MNYQREYLTTFELVVPSFDSRERLYMNLLHCERREHPSQSYGTPKKRKKILNIGRRTILYKTFFYSFSILN